MSTRECLLDEGGSSQLDAMVEKWLSRLDIPGMTVGVRQGGVTWLRGYGAATAGGTEAIDERTAFRIGSITKVFTAAAVMKLAGQGLFALDQLVRELMPDLPLRERGVANEITVRHLLSHQAGLDCDLVADWRSFGDGADAIAAAVSALRGLKVWFPPGYAWGYSNSGYLVLGRLIELCTGLSYDAAIRSTLLGPLALNDTGFSSSDRTPSQTASGHVGRGGKQVAVPFGHPRARWASGGLVSTAEDLLRFAASHFAASDGHRACEATKVMRQPQCRSSWGSDWGCGWELLLGRGVTVASHRGTVNGFQSQLTIVPEQRFAAVVLSNSARGAVAIRPIVEWLLAKYASAGAPKVVPAVVSESELRRCVGSYHGVELDANITVGKGDLVVEARAREGAYTAFRGVTAQRAVAVEGDAFLVTTGDLAGTRFDLLMGPDEEPAFLRFAGRILRRQRP
ncbi:MAG TPA: serine hydrolase domain-containing protein [Solirubrobacteraceae bacterium]|jgi:CubicO group peptidase (beta-lactamase class C family)|nr:serine hydrolase domain-containing protein [Solirubrobacteraceae bacterium]